MGGKCGGSAGDFIVGWLCKIAVKSRCMSKRKEMGRKSEMKSGSRGR